MLTGAFTIENEYFLFFKSLSKQKPNNRINAPHRAQYENCSYNEG